MGDRRRRQDGSRRPNANAKRNAGESFGNVCVHCGADLSAEGAARHIDHWIPRSRFVLPCLRRWFKHRDREFNLAASCAACNLKKRAGLPKRTDPLTIRFFLYCCAEEMADAWENGTPVPLDVLVYWSAHEVFEREGAKLHMEGLKEDTCRWVINKSFMERNDSHFIASQLLQSAMVGAVFKAFGYALAVLCRGLVSACDAVCGAGEPMHSLGVYKHWWDEDVRFLGEIWPAHCAVVAKGLGFEPTPKWKLPAAVKPDEDAEMLDLLCGCKELR